MDEALLARVAEIRGMPASLVERSAEARAKKLGISTEDVLREWAGEEAAPTAAVEALPEDASAEAPADAVPPAAAPAGGPLSREELLEQAASAKGMPASLVERSASARAKKEGLTTEAVLAEWAGVDVGDVVADAPAAETPAVVAAADEDAEVGDTGSRAEVLEPTAPTEDVAVVVADQIEDEETSSPWSRYPALLTASFVIIPLLAVLYILAIPNGPTCGSSGQLAVDPASGEAVNCDGTAYGVDASDNFGLGAAVYTAQCVACHGAEGGGGVGPAMSGGAVLVTFPTGSCGDHAEWIRLGSAGWPDSTYGATAKPVAGGMPGFETSLSELELLQVVLYERVAFGGQDLMEAEAGCGFGEEGDA